MSYQVVAPLVLAKDRDGTVHHQYQGAVINWLSDEQAKHLLDLDMVVKVGVDDDGVVDEDEADEADEDDVDAPPADGDKPAEDATKAELVEWVSASAVKDDGSDYSEAELNRMNKGQLWELINAVDEEG